MPRRRARRSPTLVWVAMCGSGYPMSCHGLQQVQAKKPVSAGAPEWLKADTGQGASPALKLADTTLFTSNYCKVDPITGEVLPFPAVPPVSVGLIQYPDGGGELYGAYRMGSKDNGVAAEREEIQQAAEEREHGPLVASLLANKRDELKAERSVQTAVQRARTQVRRIIRMYELRVMVTFTFPDEGVHDYDQALKLMQRFINDHGLCLHRGGVWLAVPELHAGGHGWHWHVAVKDFFSEEELFMLRGKWTLYLLRKGFKLPEGCKWVHVNLSGEKKRGRLAGYLSKYLQKAFEDDTRTKGRKRYLASKQIKIDVKRGNAYSLNEVRELAWQIKGAHVFDSQENDGWLGPDIVWASW